MKKMNVEGWVEKYKVGVVAKGYSWVEGIEFGDIFYTFPNLNFIRTLLSIRVAFYFKVEHMDMKETFLN